MSNCSLQALDFGQLEQIGIGQYGYVFKAMHMPTQQKMAIKKTLCTREQYDELSKFWDFIFDLNASRQEEGREFIVNFYGTIFFDSDCWLCMELMDVSLDKFNDLVYSHHGDFIPEFVVAQIARSMVMALNFLEKHSLKVRRKSYTQVKDSHSNGFATPYADVKTSNVLISRSGYIKLCDLGMCRRLIDPTASIQGGEWYNYIAPERICPGPSTSLETTDIDGRHCDSRPDVWAIGISMYQTSTGVLPFHDVKLAFQVIAAIVNGPDPQLEPMEGRRSSSLTSFVNSCLKKNVRERPQAHELLDHPFIENAGAERNVEKLSAYFSSVLDNKSPISPVITQNK